MEIQFVMAMMSGQSCFLFLVRFETLKPFPSVLFQLLLISSTQDSNLVYVTCVTQTDLCRGLTRRKRINRVTKTCDSQT